MTKEIARIFLSVSLIAFTSQVFAGEVITLGNTISIADSPLEGALGVGEHFHSSTLPPPAGIDAFEPVGFAEVGNFGNEEVRGVSEFALGGLGSATSAVLSFDTLSGGLFPPINNVPFAGSINLHAFVGNGIEDLTDFGIAPYSLVSTLSTAGLTFGTSQSFNILSLYNTAISSSWTHLGFRLSRVGGPFITPVGTDETEGAWTFNNFQITTNDEPIQSVPEPEAMLLLALGLLSLGLSRSRRIKR